MDFSLILACMLYKVLKEMDLIFIPTPPTVLSGDNESGCGYEIFSVLFSIFLRRSMNLMNCSLAPYDLSKSSSSSRNRPALVFTYVANSGRNPAGFRDPAEYPVKNTGMTFRKTSGTPLLLFVKSYFATSQRYRNLFYLNKSTFFPTGI
jgi:hypothetical protein